MASTLHKRIRHAIRSIRARGYTPGRSPGDGDPLTVVMSLLSDEARRRSGDLDLHGAEALTREGVDALFEDGKGASPKELAEFLAGASVAADGIEPGSANNGVATSILLGVTVLGRLLDEGRLTQEHAAALYVMVNGVDDIIVRRDPAGYALRPPILVALLRGFDKLSGGIRHVDLVVRLKWALAAVDLDRHGLFDVGLEILRDLPGRITRRIEETHDGIGVGPTPGGQSIDPHRVAGRPLQGPLGILLVETYRSLPLLKAEALFELGRALTETRFGVSEANLEEAHRCLEQASVGFFAAGEQGRAALAAVVAAECLDRLIDLAAGPEVHRARLDRLRDYGDAAQRQVKASELSPEDKDVLAVLAAAAWSRAWTRGLLDRLVATLGRWAEGEASGHDPGAILDEHGRGVEMYLVAVIQYGSGDPWLALSALAAMTGEAIHLLGVCARLITASRPDPETLAGRALEDLLRRFVDTDLLSVFVDAVAAAALDLKDPGRARARRLAAGFRRHPLGSPRRLFEAIGALFQLSSASGIALTEPQWSALAEVLAQLGVPALSLARMLDFQRSEADALARALPSGTPCPGYLERRIRTIEAAMARPELTASERSILSGWLGLLVMSYRRHLDDFSALPAERALWFLERLGASAYRADAIWYARSRILPPPRFERPEEERMGRVTFEALPSDPDVARELAWSAFHLSREELDLWGRYRTVEEARRTRPFIAEIFKVELDDPTQLIITAPLDTDLEVMEHDRGIPKERWLRTESAFVTRLSPRTHAEFCSLIDSARRRMHVACRELNLLDEIGPEEVMPDVDVERLRALLVAQPSLAIVVAGGLVGLPLPILVFSGQNGRVERVTVGSAEERAEQADAFQAWMDVSHALAEDRRDPSGASWYRLGDAIRTLCGALAPWSRALSEALSRRGTTDVLLLARSIHAAVVPWEELPADERGARIGERYATCRVETLAALPAPALAAESRREGTLHIHGGGASIEQMRPAEAVLRSLALASIGEAPVPGEEACDAPWLHEHLRAAARLRLYAHGYHDQAMPHKDRLTLVDGGAPEERVDLNIEQLRSLPLGGMRCVELWACEGAAHGRHVVEHGVAEEPEDLTAAFLLAGAGRVIASPWHVPSLPSALLMELFALLVDADADEARALSTARIELRAAFAAGGPAERAMEQHLERRLAHPGEPAPGVTGDPLSHAFADAVHELRAGWYATRGLPPPLRLPLHGDGLARLVRFVPPRSERLARACDGGARDGVPATVSEYLRPLRNPACWAGWRLTLRSVDEWGA